MFVDIYLIYVCQHGVSPSVSYWSTFLVIVKSALPVFVNSDITLMF